MTATLRFRVEERRVAMVSPAVPPPTIMYCYVVPLITVDSYSPFSLIILFLSTKEGMKTKEK